jgi:AraC-like DNA-binding protein
MSKSETAGKRGYLNEDFKLFHINDRSSMDFDSHTHDFHKIILCLAGSVTYVIEGKTYILSPWDILLVPRGTIHHSKTDSQKAYERMVLFINDGFLENSDKEGFLSGCFSLATNEGKYLYSVRSENRKEIITAAQNIENAATEKKPGSELLMTGSFIRLMVYINRLSLDQSGMQGMISDEKIDAVIAYINENFKKTISVSDLADKFHISRSYLMHRFKDVTGGSVHNFITQKRLNLALSMLRDGTPAMEAALVCGFSDYTVFYKSFRKTFGYSPADALAKH